MSNVVQAQTFSKVVNTPGVKDLLSKVADNIVIPIIGFMFLIAFFMFVYGIFGMISSADDSDKRENGKRSIIWGVVGMTIMLSAFGIVRVIANTVGVPDPFL